MITPRTETIYMLLDRKASAHVIQNLIFHLPLF